MEMTINTCQPSIVLTAEGSRANGYPAKLTSPVDFIIEKGQDEGPELSAGPDANSRTLNVNNKVPHLVVVRVEHKRNFAEGEYVTPSVPYDGPDYPLENWNGLKDGDRWLYHDQYSKGRGIITGKFFVNVIPNIPGVDKSTLTMPNVDLHGLSLSFSNV